VTAKENKSMAQNIYDDPDFFAKYSQFPRSREGLAAAPEWPTLRDMLPPMTGIRVLDLGCGFGAFARWAASQGAATVLGLDLSEKMLARARASTQAPNVTYRRANLEQLDLPAASFDLVYSSLALHYLADFDSLCAAVRRALTPGARFVFSVEHPIYTAPSHPAWQTGEQGQRIWPLNNYLMEGKRVTDWLTSGVVKYHRTLGSYVSSLLANGFTLFALVEWGPTQEQIAQHPEWADELHRPPFLLVGAQVNAQD